MRNTRVSLAAVAAVSAFMSRCADSAKAARPAVAKVLPVLIGAVALSGGAAGAQTGWTAPTPPDYLPLIGAVQTYAQTMIATYGPPVILVGVTMGGFRWVAGRVTRIFGG